MELQLKYMPVHMGKNIRFLHIKGRFNIWENYKDVLIELDVQVKIENIEFV